MKIITIALTLLLSLNSFADCREAYEADIAKRLVQKSKVDNIGKVATGATFIAVGGFYGYMGVALLGPLWAGVVLGSSFGAIAALPVGVTFVVVSQVSKTKIKNRIGGLNIISEAIMGPSEADSFEKLHEKLIKTHPLLTADELAQTVRELNSSDALCDGTVSGSEKIKLASPKQIYQFIDGELSQSSLIIQ